jgi:hypothetical protein
MNSVPSNKPEDGVRIKRNFSELVAKADSSPGEDDEEITDRAIP